MKSSRKRKIIRKSSFTEKFSNFHVEIEATYEQNEDDPDTTDSSVCRRSKRRKKGNETSDELDKNSIVPSNSSDAKETLIIIEKTKNGKRILKDEEKLLNCNDCDYNTRDPKKMESHEFTHVDRSFHKCQKCPFKTKSKRRLRRHLKLHLDKNDLQATCPICSEILPSFQSYTAHKRRHIIFRPTKIYKYKCSECQYSTKSMPLVWKHLILHYRKKYKCPFSDYSSDRKSALERHFKWKHSKRPRKYQIRAKINGMLNVVTPNLSGTAATHVPRDNDTCGSQFIPEGEQLNGLNEENVPIAMRKENIDPKPDKSVFSFQSSKQKIVVLNELFERCRDKSLPNMDEQFIRTTQENFEKGLLLKWDRLFTKVPATRKKYSCNQCNYKTFKSSHLSYHMYVHSSEEYFCPVCDFVSHSKISLEKHVKNHGPTKNFNCRKCNYQTNSSFAYKNHERKHLGVRVFKCSICPFATNYKADLARHQNIHAPKEGKYSCDQCSYVAVYKNDLALHRIDHKKKNIR